jgi:hypothetical protein
VRRQETPREQADLLGELLLSAYFEALKVRTSGSPGNQGQERRVAVERRRGPVHTGLESVDEVFLSTRAGEELTRPRGLLVLEVAHRSPRTKE